MNDKKPLGLKPCDFHVDLTNIFEPIIIDNPTEQEKWLKKKVIEAIEDLPKPRTGYLMMTPQEDKIEDIESFKNDEISFKAELKDDFGFRKKEK